MSWLALSRPLRAVLAIALCVTLVLFTTAYRFGPAFSPATAARCHSLSSDHTDARNVFDGAFGPLPVVGHEAQRPSPTRMASVSPEALPPPQRLVGLVLSPVRRPPPLTAAD
jgi:hypothetical protein